MSYYRVYVLPVNINNMYMSQFPMDKILQFIKSRPFGIQSKTFHVSLQPCHLHSARERNTRGVSLLSQLRQGPPQS